MFLVLFFDKFDPLEADISRRPKAPTVRIGLELRVRYFKIFPFEWMIIY